MGGQSGCEFSTERSLYAVHWRETLKESSEGCGVRGCVAAFHCASSGVFGNVSTVVYLFMLWCDTRVVDWWGTEMLTCHKLAKA